MLLANEQAMLNFGAALAKATQGKGLIYLCGDLGAGKTTIARGVMQAFGHQGAVKSPTYTLVEPYSIQGKTIYHFDLYRLADPEELEFMGIRDYLDEQALCLIEWPEKAKGILPPADLQVNIQHCPSGRELLLECASEYGKSLKDKLQLTVTG